MSETSINASTIRRFKAQWQKLRDSRAKVDFETAGLAYEIRQLFPKGASGDIQFSTWVQQHLKVWAPTAAMLTRAAKAFVLFPDGDDWVNFGGWQSMGFLLSFSAKDRRKIAKSVRQIVEARDYTVGYTTVRNTAYALGCRQKRGGPGRPNRLEVEEKLGTLREFVEQLIEDGAVTRDGLAEAVSAALAPTKLAQLAHAILDD